jgi:hypothetical protein
LCIVADVLDNICVNLQCYCQQPHTAAVGPEQEVFSLLVAAAAAALLLLLLLLLLLCCHRRHCCCCCCYCFAAAAATAAAAAAATEPVEEVFSLLVALVGLAGFALALALVEQIVLETNLANVSRGSRVYESGHVSHPCGSKRRQTNLL